MRINPTDHSVRGVSFSTFAASAPKPIFIQTEDGLSEIDTSKFPLCTTFDEVLWQLQAVRDEEHDYATVVIDSLDWPERLIWDRVCADYGVTPFRTQGGLICRPENLFQEICYEIGIKELIAEGYLSKIKYPPTAPAVARRGGYAGCAGGTGTGRSRSFAHPCGRVRRGGRRKGDGRGVRRRDDLPRDRILFPSDDEWEEIERRARTEMWIREQMGRLMLFLAATLILFGLVFFIASHASPRHYDPWAATCEAYLRERNQHGD